MIKKYYNIVNRIKKIIKKNTILEKWNVKIMI